LTDGDLFMNGPGRDGAWAIGRMRVQVKKPGDDKWEDVMLVNATADFSTPEQMRPRPAGDPKQTDQSQGGASGEVPVGPVAHLLDDDEHSAWSSDRGHLVRHQPSVAVVQFEKPLDLPAGTRLKIAIKGHHSRDSMLGCCRFSLTKGAADRPRRDPRRAETRGGAERRRPCGDLHRVAEDDPRGCGLERTDRGGLGEGPEGSHDHHACRVAFCCPASADPPPRPRHVEPAEA
ncbi:hypothetical protein EBR04_09840, partial [bacterium]|nr:hypothetical protein [bacterium]